MTAWRQLSLLKGPRQRGTKPPLAREFATHCAIADTLRVSLAPGWLWTHFPSGEKRDTHAGARLKRMGLKPGFFDLLLIGPDGVHHWMELKAGNAPLSIPQLGFMQDLAVRNVPFAIARSYDEAIEQLRKWGAVRVSVSA